MVMNALSFNDDQLLQVFRIASPCNVILSAAALISGDRQAQFDGGRSRFSSRRGRFGGSEAGTIQGFCARARRARI